MWAQSGNSGEIHFFLLSNGTLDTELLSVLDREAGPTVESIVDAVFFQGPHYGDRSGILDFTFSALERGQIPIWAEACSVASIYLVLADGWGAKTIDLLTDAFEIPKSIK